MARGGGAPRARGQRRQLLLAADGDEGRRYAALLRPRPAPVRREGARDEQPPLLQLALLAEELVVRVGARVRDAVQQKLRAMDGDGW